MNLVNRIISLIILSSGMAASTMAANFTAKASLDSAYILMGKQTQLHIEVVGPLNESGGLTSIDSLWKEVEIISMGEPRINDLGNNRKELLQDIIIQSFDSGLYVIPPVIYIQDSDTVVTNSPVLKVIPVAVDTLKTVHDFADVADVNRHLFDFMPDWMTDYGLWILLTLIVIAGSLFVYFKWLRQGRIPLIPTKKPLPPYQVAIQQLEILRNEHLCERGEEKEYYTRLTDILRIYLDKRFGINAMEMTSSQIMRALQTNDSTKDSERFMSSVLEIADFVKFAKVRPLPDDNEQAFRSAIQFVEDTKPVEVSPEEEGEHNEDKNVLNQPKEKID